MQVDGSKGQGSITLAFTSYAKDEQISKDASKDRKNVILMRIIRADDLKKADLFARWNFSRCIKDFHERSEFM